MDHSPRQTGLGTASQAFRRAGECDRLAALTRDAQRRRLLLRLKCSWIQYAGEVRSNEIGTLARKQRRHPPIARRQDDLRYAAPIDEIRGGSTDYVNDGKPWSVMDIVDLASQIRMGATAQEAAQFLSRAGTVEDVKAAAEGRGLRFLDQDASD
jgi:hypothetical protein